MENKSPEEFNRPDQGEGAEPQQVHEPQTNLISRWVETLTNIRSGRDDASHRHDSHLYCAGACGGVALTHLLLR